MTQTNNTDWQALCSASDLIAEAGIATWTEQGPVAIFYLPDTKQQVYAIGHYDPIGEANVLARGIVGDIQGEPVVASPLYKQHFSLLTGACLEDDQQAVPVFPARLRDGRVEIDLSGRHQATEAA